MEPATFGTGAVIGLNAVGKQDELISDLKYSPEKSLFTPSPTTSTQFLRYYRPYKQQKNMDVPNWPFDQSFTIAMKPTTMGDLLSNMFLKISLPASYDGIQPYSIWSSLIGFKIFDYIEFYADSTLIQRLDDTSLYVTSLMLSTESERTAAPIIERKTLLGFSEFVGGPLDLYIPIPFWFCRKFHTLRNKPDIPDDKLYRDSSTNNFKDYFPVCAIRNQTIYVKIKFKPLGWFSGVQVLSQPIQEFTLVTEEISLGEQERYYTTHSPLSQTITTMEKINSSMTSSTTDVKSATSGNTKTVPIFKYGLQTNYPIRTLFWFFRYKPWGESPPPSPWTARPPFSERYNFSYEYGVALNTTRSSLVSAVDLEFNNRTIKFGADSSFKTITSAYYFLFVEPLINGLYVPYTPIMSYSFDINPTATVDTGSTDYSIKNKTNNLNIVNYFANRDGSWNEGAPVNILEKNYEFMCYATVLKVLEFAGGYVTVKASST